MADYLDDFDTDEVPDDGQSFETLPAGRYLLRPTAFSRSTSGKGHPQLVFRVDAVAGPSTGNTLWFITLTEKAKVFVRRAVVAVSEEERWRGKFSSDDDVKNLFLGRVFGAVVKHRSYTSNGEKKTVAELKTVHRFPSDEFDGDPMDHPHEPAEKYWENEVFGQSDGSSGDTGGGWGGDDKDEIPF